MNIIFTDGQQMLQNKNNSKICEIIYFLNECKIEKRLRFSMFQNKLIIKKL